VTWVHLDRADARVFIKHVRNWELRYDSMSDGGDVEIHQCCIVANSRSFSSTFTIAHVSRSQ